MIPPIFIDCSEHAVSQDVSIFRGRTCICLFVAPVGVKPSFELVKRTVQVGDGFFPVLHQEVILKKLPVPLKYVLSFNGLLLVSLRRLMTGYHP
jgi:hypothetical protein